MITLSIPAIFALVAAVIIISALISGLIEQSKLPQVAVFLLLGAILGPYGLGVVDIKLDSPGLQIVSTLSLALVLFVDAVTLDTRELRKHAMLAFIILVPGTLAAVAAISLFGSLTLGLPVAAAVMLGAALASTDPVLLRGLLRAPWLPSRVRLPLRLESSLNDVVLLPIVLLAMAFADGDGNVNLAMLLLKTLVLGPGIGVVVALVAIGALELMRKRFGVRRDYESLYSLGVALAAFAAAESVHTSGFLSAFAAGLTIAVLDVDLCECFTEYGETTAEMSLLFTFVLLGISLIWSGFKHLTWTTALFVVLALAARPLSLMVALSLNRLDRKSSALISWFGPRGLSSLLLILLPVFNGTPGSSYLFEICAMIVVVSVVLHGGSYALIEKKLARKGKRLKMADAPTTQIDRITVEELKGIDQEGQSVVIADVRSVGDFMSSGECLSNAIRIEPGTAKRDAVREGLPQDAWIALFCT